MSKFEHGTIACYDTDSGKKNWEYATTRCVHCCTPFKLRPGSGIRRGFCYNCNGMHCGKPACRGCEKGNGNWEFRFAELEGTRKPGTVLVAVPRPQSRKLEKLFLPFVMRE